VVVDDFDTSRDACRPCEAHSVLVIDPDAVLTFPITLELLESIPRRDAQVLQLAGDVELSEFASGHPLDAFEAPHAKSAGEAFGVRRSE
jgi:hypothetical protein